MITIALRKRTLSPVRLVLKVTFFCCYLPQWCFFVFLGSINQTRLGYCPWGFSKGDSKQQQRERRRFTSYVNPMNCEACAICSCHTPHVAFPKSTRHNAHRNRGDPSAPNVVFSLDTYRTAAPRTVHFLNSCRSLLLPSSSPYNKTSDVFSPEYQANTSRRIDFSADVITNKSSNIRLYTAFAIHIVGIFPNITQFTVLTY